MAEKLTFEKLKARCRDNCFSFETTAEVPPLEGIIGQDRAVQSLAFGLRIKDEGYNIYVMGLTGTGRNSYTKSIVNELAYKQKTPNDWCYVFNFENPDKPIAISFDPGEGHDFKEEMENLIEQLKEEIPKTFESEDFKNLRNEVFQKFQKQSLQSMDKLNKLAKDHQLLFKRSGKGFVTLPTQNGKPLSEQDLQVLSEDTLRDIESRITKFQEDAETVFEEIRGLENEVREQLINLEKNAGLSIVGPIVDSLRQKFSNNQQVIKYLNSLQNDLLKNIKNFFTDEVQEDNPLGLLKERGKEGWDIKYKVNLFVDNKDTQGAPVVIENNATYYNLMGMIEFQNRMGILATDFTKVKAGSIHKANGGYLILQAENLFGNQHSWRALKRALKENESKIENIPDGSGVISGLKPEGIPLDLKVLVIGTYQIYKLLYNYEEDFKKLFKIQVDFETEMAREDQFLQKMAAFISRHCKDKNLKDFHRSAVSAIIDYSSRLADNQRKLSTRFNEIVEILTEANVWADLEGSEIVFEKHIKKTIAQKRFRSDKYEQKLHELFEDGTFLISVDGFNVGQINGLAVYDLGDYSFGKPSRITINTFAGKKGVVNIEKEAQMSGRSHNKGVQILSGYLGLKFAQKFPLTLTATLCFEQSYDGVDGDSASSTELYGLLSSLSGIPINQSIAVTGSVNQKGEIQPIGGVNQKIEGFFKTCKIKGLTGDQGVMIPHQNVKNLMLDNDVVEAVKEGKFHIYSVKTIEEGIELLTGVPAGTADEEGNYTEGTVYYKVAKTLKGYYLESLKYKD
jgi:lon-related putative ATP-dependent protease